MVIPGVVSDAPRLSVVIPTRNEGSNVVRIAARLSEVLTSESYEIIFVDESTDTTPAVLGRLTALDPRVHYTHRIRCTGLGASVASGIGVARGELVAVMDADLQHPPEALPGMLEAIAAGNDLVVASRFLPGGRDQGLNWRRKVISGGARKLAQAMLASARRLSDPTSGFFVFRRSGLEGARLEPLSWKILLEVMERGRWARVAEVAYSFEERALGESKLTVRAEWDYLRHLAYLTVLSPSDRRPALYVAVRLSSAGLCRMVRKLLAGVAPELGAPVSEAVSMAWSCVLSDRLTWADASGGSWRFSAARVAPGTLSAGMCQRVTERWLRAHQLVPERLAVAAGWLVGATVGYQICTRMVSLGPHATMEVEPKTQPTDTTWLSVAGAGETAASAEEHAAESIPMTAGGRP